MLQRYLVVWLLLLSALAYFWPSLAGQIDPAWASAQRDPFLWFKTPVTWSAAGPWNQSLLWYLIGLTMLAIGWLLPRDELAQVIRRWPTVLGGTCLQYTSMPLLAWFFGWLWIQDPDIRAGMILVGCVPGAMASNVLTLAARGNVSYSLSLTTSATLLSPLVVPAALAIFLGKSYEYDATATALQLLLFVVQPVLVGHAMGRSLPRLERLAHAVGTRVANLAILIVIAAVVADTRDYLVFAPRVLAALLMINVGGYLAGWFGARLLGIDSAMRRALTLEIGMQNSALGTVMAISLFPNSPAAIPTALYMFGCMLTGTLLARWWASRD